MRDSIEFIIDFDGTCVTHNYPSMGKDIGADVVLKKLVENGHRLILFTMRPSTNGTLQKAVAWFIEKDIPLYGVQTNPTQKTWTDSPKAYGQIFIDDAAYGCPLKVDESLSSRPFVDWDKIEEMLIRDELI